MKGNYFWPQADGLLYEKRNSSKVKLGTNEWDTSLSSIGCPCKCKPAICFDSSITQKGGKKNITKKEGAAK
ncbi:hypothetical protein POVCU1_038540 [Plasmodium ovale curtisi]|uniref:Uncharacterized protein n=1 Tax=Plasmodium ovale curtisi TaxID=864141 RepID=A0A1A8WZZ7_PLAOA|nr:hypothetical protein POVCU1_038540 [Plasmodium ovale curtisi]